METNMKSILGISITFHVAVFCTTLLIGSQRGMLHVPATEPVVLEMHLVATPHVLQATKNAMPEVRKSMQTTATQPLENAPPKPELPTAAISSKLPSVDAIEAGNSGNGTPVPSASTSTTGRSIAAGTAHEGRDTAQTVVAARADQLPWIITSPAPEYPREARRKGWIGRVSVHVLITEKGTVQQTEIIASSGHTELDEAALMALRKWTFHPAQKDGHVIAAWVVVPVLFRLDS
jgi:protein TonB